MVDLLVAVRVKEDTKALKVVFGSKDIALATITAGDMPRAANPIMFVVPSMFFSFVYQKAKPSPKRFFPWPWVWNRNVTSHSSSLVGYSTSHYPVSTAIMTTAILAAPSSSTAPRALTGDPALAG